MEQLSQSGSRGRRRTGNEPAPHERVKSERRANEPQRTASAGGSSANNAGRANTPAAEQTPARPKSRYIPALDGLRTLAVSRGGALSPNLTWAQGGLLGVTIFFVLSGYLITRLLLNEVAKTGRIDLKSFWIRRIRRLVPAVVTVVVATCALCTVFNHVMLAGVPPTSCRRCCSSTTGGRLPKTSRISMLWATPRRSRTFGRLPSRNSST